MKYGFGLNYREELAEFRAIPDFGSENYHLLSYLAIAAMGLAGS
jgi:hypothetical protein